MLVKLESKTRFVCNENASLSFMSMNSTIYIEKNKKRRDSTELVSRKLGMENQNMFFVNRIACSVEDRQSLGYQSWPFFLLHTRAIPGHWGDYCSMPRLARNIFTNISTHTSLNELNQRVSRRKCFKLTLTQGDSTKMTIESGYRTNRSSVPVQQWKITAAGARLHS